MRKLIYGINLTIDGCCDHTKGTGGEDVHDFFRELLQDTDTLLYGRKTYELMVPFWPDMAKSNSGPTKSLNDFAHAFASVKNIVVLSRSLAKVEQKNAIIVRGDLREEILKLKQQEGKDILVGGVDVPCQLIQLGLIDEFYIVIQPVLVGDGRRLLEGINLQEKLQLIGSKNLKLGNVVLHYAKG